MMNSTSVMTLQVSTETTMPAIVQPNSFENLVGSAQLLMPMTPAISCTTTQSRPITSRKAEIPTVAFRIARMSPLSMPPR